MVWNLQILFYDIYFKLNGQVIFRLFSFPLIFSWNTGDVQIYDKGGLKIT